MIGFVNGRTAEDTARSVAAFRKGLNEAGYVEGKNVMVEYHWLDGRYDTAAFRKGLNETGATSRARA